MTVAQSGPWPVWKLGVLLYPFVAAAVAVNLFLLALVGLPLAFQACRAVVSILLSIHWVARELGIGSLGTSPDGCRGELRLYQTSTATIHEEGKMPK